MKDLITKSDKIKIISNITNEVKDLHPLLKDLFNQLNNIENVEYTHGTNEMGADFVLRKKDSTLNQTVYVGIIAKTGKIRQDFTSIERQIEECQIEKALENGKKTIHISEIWVVSSDTVSNNAKIKISNKYPATNISFVDRDKLIELIDNNYEGFWMSVPSRLNSYFQKVQAEITELDNSLSLFGKNNKLDKDFYIDQGIEEVQTTKRKNKGSKNIRLHESILDNDLIFLEGKGGFGKSKMMRNTVKYFSNPINFQKHQIIPVFFKYSDFSESFNNDLITMLIEKGIDDPDSARIENTIVIFLDGFDEKYFDNNDELDRLEQITTSVLAQKNTKLVISSRPLEFDEIQRVKHSNFKWYKIKSLAYSDIYAFFTQLCDQSKVSERIKNDVKKSELFKQLPKSPIAAILLATLINENSAELPSNLTELYSKYIELMLGRWDIHKGLQSQKEYEAARSILIEIAKYFLDNDLTYLSIDECKGFFKEYLSKRNLDIDSESLFEKISKRSGIIQKEPDKNRIQFKHRTFIEFFYADYKNRTNDSDFIDSRIFSETWKNIYFFYIGLKKDCKPVLEKIVNTPAESPAQRYYKTINLSEYFLAGFVTPYAIVEENLRSLIEDYTDLYIGTKNNQIDLGLKEFPEMFLLWFFQSGFRSRYSYDFFYKAILSSIEETYSNPTYSDEKIAYMLYFQTLVLIDLEKKNPLKGLMEDFRQDLPFPIKIALGYENDDISPKILKKLDKSIKKTLKNSQTTKKYFFELYEKPLKLLNS